jgi:hypothetical protein
MRRALLVVAATLGALPAAFIACSSSSSLPALPPGYSPEASVFDGSIRPSDAPHRTDTKEVDSKAGCPSGPASGPSVQELDQPGETPPAAGGALDSGTYVLSRIYSYIDNPEAGGGTPLEEQKTIILLGDSYVWSQATGTVEAGVGATTLTSGDFKASGTTLTLTQHCPTSAPAAAYPYTAAGTGLSIYTDASVIEFYSGM